MKQQIFTLGRAGGALGVLLVLVVVLACGLWFTKQAADAAALEVEAKNTVIEGLKKRMLIPVRTANDKIEANEFLEGANYALAANGMQQRIVGLIESSGGTLVTVGVDPADDSEKSSLKRVVVQAVAELTNDGLQQLLYELESGRPYILVDSLNVRNAPSRGESDTDASNRSGRLAVDLRAYGYFRGAGK
jgi:general secretion pathway protein M